MAQPGGNGGEGGGMAGPLQPGARVSLELPEAGTCVAVVASKRQALVRLNLLDELSEGDLPAGSTLELFMLRGEGIYRWLCLLSSPPADQEAEVELLSTPVLVQRRTGHRLGAELEATVRRIHSARRGPAHLVVVADLSLGGMKLVGPFRLSTGDTLEVTMDIGPQVRVRGRAVMAYPTTPGTWAAHVSFLEGQRDVIEQVGGYIAQQFRDHRKV
ncbi:MAG: PilZ domain-containing protein [Acidimicrobiales bacterium]